MRVVVALGGHALLRRGEKPSIENQVKNVRTACEALAQLASGHDVAVTHGNGPQIGLLAIRSVRRNDLPPFPLDVLGAETQGMIGYLIESALSTGGSSHRAATVLTMVEVDPADPAFENPTKPIGRFYDKPTADRLAAALGWTFKPDGDSFRRVVASPAPKRILEMQQISLLLDQRCVVVCAGGGGIPTAFGPHGDLVGVEAVLDKDRTSALLADQIRAQFLVVTTDADAIYLDWPDPAKRRIRRVHPDVLLKYAAEFDGGSMRPKATAVSQFVKATGGTAAVGSLSDVSRILQQADEGTIVTLDATETEFY